MAHRDDTGAHEPPRLKPEMACRRLIVLQFVRDYILKWNGSPSLGEIAAGCAISRTRARQLIGKLVRDGDLLRVPGPRGLSLPDQRDQALRRLRELGWNVDAAQRQVSQSGDPCTNPTLMPPARLDYIPIDDDREETHAVQRPSEAEGGEAKSRSG